MKKHEWNPNALYRIGNINAVYRDGFLINLDDYDKCHFIRCNTDNTLILIPGCRNKCSDAFFIWVNELEGVNDQVICDKCGEVLYPFGKK